MIPRAGRSGPAGIRDNGLLIRLNAPPLEGAANTELIDVLADLLDVPKRNVTIVSGEDMAAPGISVEVGDVDAVHAEAVERGLEIAYPLRDEPWGVRRFMLRDPSGTVVNVLSHIPRERLDTAPAPR